MRSLSFAILFISLSSFALGHQPLQLPYRPTGMATGSVPYVGGPVLSQAKVYAVFWGHDVPQDSQNFLVGFYKALMNSDYLDQLAEYATPDQKIGRGTFAGSLTISPKNTALSLTQQDVEQELEAQLNSGSLPKPDANSLYMLHFPAGFHVTISFGASCTSWAADHEVYHSASFGNVYYALYPCSDSLAFDQQTSSISHELAEAITDPASPLSGQPSVKPAAWIRDDGQEIGDLCAWDLAQLTSGSTTYSVQKEWLNSLGGCNPASFTAPSKQ